MTRVGPGPNSVEPPCPSQPSRPGSEFGAKNSRFLEKVMVIGAGPGGYAAAIRAAELGAEVALIEKDRPGGACLNRGCIPSKIMRRAADVALELAGAAAWGFEPPAAPAIKLPVLRARQKSVVEAQAEALVKRFKSLGIKLVRGAARVEAPGRVAVRKDGGETEIFEGDHIILAPGSKPGALPGLTPDGQKIITSDEALWMEELPKSLLVLGGGVIGCELARIFHDLGSQVTLVEALPRLLPLPGLDEEISKTFARCLKKAKLPFHVGHTLSQTRPTAGGLAVTLKPRSGDGPAKELEVEKLLVTVGRVPDLAGLGLEELGLAMNPKGWIVADENFRTNIPGLWAVGDCLGPERVMLAHAATAEGMAAAENIFGGSRRAGPGPNAEGPPCQPSRIGRVNLMEKARGLLENRVVDYGQVPSAVFTVPEIAAVGLTLAGAEAKFPGSRAHDFLFRQLGKAQAQGETDGLCRLVSGPDGRILGAHIIGHSASILIAEATLAVSQGLTLEDLANTIHAHPTMSEALWESAHYHGGNRRTCP